MRVLHVVESAQGGVARHLGDLVRLQAQDGIVATVLYSDGRNDSAWTRAEATMRSAGATLVPFPMRRAIGPWDARDALRLRAWVRRQTAFDVIHAHSSKAGALVRMAFPLRRDKVYTPHALATMSPGLGPRKRAVYGAIERALGRSRGLTVLVSTDEFDHAHAVGLAAGKLRLVPLGVPHTPTGNRDAARSMLGVDAGETIVGFVGRFWAQKDPLLAVEIFARFAADHEGRLVMVGYGEDESRVRERASMLGIADRLMIVNDGDAPALIPAFDVLLLSSGYESFGYVLLEAVVNGVPAVTTPVGIAPALAAEGGARLFPIGDAEAGAKALVETLAPSRREAGRDEALRSAGKFSDAEMHAGVKRVYGELKTPKR